ncbi:DUF3626 domain-containing protein [Micromonospora sp. DH14]|uniref:DUF3626 domain-containing protein n=1 Tax=Micromonospora sp. DH14 TaxID=3040120 RepID=UPI0024424850|nr:DUF3626 domain-containing protein [Micromonospora sp. DH14]MDG9674397.1 DUF3626 domain-containing protein [Micromonospora sp. DH14]
MRSPDVTATTESGSSRAAALTPAQTAALAHARSLAVAERRAALAEDGVYRSQFVTGISNGGLTAYPGGDRDRWEQRMFDGAYQRTGVTAADRPTYGGMNLLGHADGAPERTSAHSFGQCGTYRPRRTLSVACSTTRWRPRSTAPSTSRAMLRNWWWTRPSPAP